MPRSTNQENPQARPKKAGIWPFVPVLLLGSMVSGLLVLVRIATDDPQFAVERDYYQKALAWDETQAQNQKNRALGWSVQLTTVRADNRTELRARVIDKAGQPIAVRRVSVDAFANVASSARTQLELTQVPEGFHRGVITPKHFGLWEFRFVVDAPGGPFTQTLRTDIKEKDAS